MSTVKRLREIRALVKSFGFPFEETRTGGGHIKFSFTNGDKKGSVIVGATPSCLRSDANNRSDLRKMFKTIGLMESDE